MTSFTDSVNLDHTTLNFSTNEMVSMRTDNQLQPSYASFFYVTVWASLAISCGLYLFYISGFNPSANILIADQNTLSKSPKLVASNNSIEVQQHLMTEQKLVNKKFISELDQIRDQMSKIKDLANHAQANNQLIENKFRLFENGLQLIKNKIEGETKQKSYMENRLVRLEDRVISLTGSLANVSKTQNEQRVTLIEQKLKSLETQKAPKQQIKIATTEKVKGEHSHQDEIDSSSLIKSAKVKTQKISPLGTKINTSNQTNVQIVTGAINRKPQTNEENTNRLSQTHFAISLGNFENLKAVQNAWNNYNAHYKKTLSGAQPRFITIRQNGKPRYELIAGPFDNALTAARICTRIRAKKKYCSETNFRGKTF